MSYVSPFANLINIVGFAHIEAEQNVFYEIGHVDNKLVRLPIIEPPESKRFHYSRDYF